MSAKERTGILINQQEKSSLWALLLPISVYPGPAARHLQEHEEQTCRLHIPFEPSLIASVFRILTLQSITDLFSHWKEDKTLADWVDHSVSYIPFYIMSCIKCASHKTGKKTAKHNFFLNCVITLIQGVMNPHPCKLGKITRIIRSTRTRIWVPLSHHHCECSKFFMQL